MSKIKELRDRLNANKRVTILTRPALLDQDSGEFFSEVTSELTRLGFLNTQVDGLWVNDQVPSKGEFWSLARRVGDINLRSMSGHFIIFDFEVDEPLSQADWADLVDGYSKGDAGMYDVLHFANKGLVEKACHFEGDPEGYSSSEADREIT
jgi:hypothetical protein